jgi:hypothetical protein
MLTSASTPSTSSAREQTRLLRLQHLAHTPLPTQRSDADEQQLTAQARRAASASAAASGAMYSNTGADSLAARLAELDGATSSAALATPHSATLHAQVSASARGQETTLRDRSARTARNEPFADARTADLSRNGHFGNHAVRPVVSAPPFSVLDPDSMRVPSLARPRFRDIDTSAVLPEPVSSFAVEPLPDIRTQAARIKRRLAADAMRFANEHEASSRRRAIVDLDFDAEARSPVRSERSVSVGSSIAFVVADDETESDRLGAHDEVQQDDDNDDRVSEEAPRSPARSVNLLPYAPSPRFVMKETAAQRRIEQRLARNKV